MTIRDGGLNWISNSKLLHFIPCLLNVMQAKAKVEYNMSKSITGLQRVKFLKGISIIFDEVYLSKRWSYVWEDLCIVWKVTASLLPRHFQIKQLRVFIKMADIQGEWIIKISRSELEGKISSRMDMYNILTQACNQH